VIFRIGENYSEPFFFMPYNNFVAGSFSADIFAASTGNDSSLLITTCHRPFDLELLSNKRFSSSGLPILA
jgi:hypothetical protein